MKTRKRTPRKVLSLLLCVLMVATSVVFANPFTAKAATTITHKKNVSAKSVYVPSFGHWGNYTISLPAYDFATMQVLQKNSYFYNDSDNTNFSSDQFMCNYTHSDTKSPINIGGTIIYIDLHVDLDFANLTFYGIYDFNPNAVNYDNTYSGAINNKDSATTQLDTSLLATVNPNDSVSSTYSPSLVQGGNTLPTLNLSSCFYGINTSNLVASYDEAISKYGKTNTKGFDAALWQNYIDKLSAVEDIVKNGYHIEYKLSPGATVSNYNNKELLTYSVEIIDPQSQIYKKQQELEKAMEPLKVPCIVTIPNSVVGLTIDKPGDNNVNIGSDFTFSVTKKTGYTQATPVVKIGTTTIGASSISGNTYTYTIGNVTENKKVTINDLPPNTYSVGYSLGDGVSKASGTATSIKHFGTATVKINVNPAYNQVKNLPISVTNGRISGGTRRGATFTYTLRGVTANTTVKVSALALNQYTVKVPDSATGLTITNTGSHTMTYGTDFTFTVTKQTGYTQATPVVKVNDVEIAGVLSDNTYTYTISNITENKNVTIDNMPLNTYQYTLPTGTGFKVTNAAGMDCNSITHGNDYSFVVSVNKAYTQTVPTVTLASGKTLELVSTAPGADGSIDYTYKAENVTKHDTVQVAAMDKNTYTAVLPTGKGYTAKTDDNLNKIVYGTSISLPASLTESLRSSRTLICSSKNSLKAI